MNIYETTEEWAKIPGTNGLYEVSNQGRVRSYRRKGQRGVNQKRAGVSPVILEGRVKENGGRTVVVRRFGRNHETTIKRLMLETFVRPGESWERASVRDGNETNLRLENLYWETMRKSKKSRNGARSKQTISTHDFSLVPVAQPTTNTKKDTSKSQLVVDRQNVKVSLVPLEHHPLHKPEPRTSPFKEVLDAFVSGKAKYVRVELTGRSVGSAQREMYRLKSEATHHRWDNVKIHQLKGQLFLSKEG